MLVARALLLWCCVLGGAAGAEPPLAAGGEIEVEVPLSDELRRTIGQGRRAPVERARVFAALPEAFDARRPCPIVVISATGDRGYHSSVQWARRYAPAGREAGWVVLGVDATVLASPETNEFRYALVRAGLDELARRWPAAATSPVAFAGFSGGAKYSGYLAALLARDGRVPVGLFLGGCNEPAPGNALVQYRPPRRAFRAVPVFLSSGIDDAIASPEDHVRVARVLRSMGFTRIRLESYPAAHVTHPPHLTEALDWFRGGAPLD